MRPEHELLAGIVLAELGQAFLVRRQHVAVSAAARCRPRCSSRLAPEADEQTGEAEEQNDADPRVDARASIARRRTAR